MKSRPILFSAPMVRALLDGTKTQTRRIMKPQPVPNEYKPGKHWWSCNKVQMMVDVEDKLQNSIEWEGFCADVCPYGKIGDRLWVRESIELAHEGSISASRYCADGSFTKADAWPWQRNKLPSIHCPRGLSRITLEITGVKVERLQDISEDDAKAEGIQQYKGPLRWIRYMDAVTGEAAHNSARDAFASLWESINGAGSWDQNPWLWCISFRRLTP